MAQPAEIIWTGPDDPYIIKTRWKNDGIHIIVEAHVLPPQVIDLDSNEVQQKVEAISNHITRFMAQHIIDT